MVLLASMAGSQFFCFLFFFCFGRGERGEVWSVNESLSERGPGKPREPAGPMIGGAAVPARLVLNLAPLVGEYITLLEYE
eukprot:SAG31_NODE_11123_length_1063_cov_22.370332_2_plen_80_part_00